MAAGMYYREAAVKVLAYKESVIGETCLCDDNCPGHQAYLGVLAMRRLRNVEGLL